MHLKIISFLVNFYNKYWTKISCCDNNPMGFYVMKQLDLFLIFVYGYSNKNLTTKSRFIKANFNLLLRSCVSVITLSLFQPFSSIFSSDFTCQGNIRKAYVDIKNSGQENAERIYVFATETLSVFFEVAIRISKLKYFVIYITQPYNKTQ
jgi:hypothetical protein